MKQFKNKIFKKNNFYSFTANSKFYKLLSLLFKIVYVNPRTYIFSLVLPLIFSILLFWLWNTYSTLEILPPILINFLSISVFFSTFYLSIFVVEWKNKNFLKRIKMIGISKFCFIYVMFLINLSLVFLSIIINILVYNAYSLIPSLNLSLKLLSNINGFIWFIYIIIITLLVLFLTTFFIFLATFFNKVAISYSVLSIITILFLIFSDVLIQPTLTNNIWIFIIIGYLIPVKYFFWCLMFFTSYQVYDFLGITQIIQNYTYGSFLVFNNVLETIFPMIFFIIISFYLLKRFFKWGY